MKAKLIIAAYTALLATGCTIVDKSGEATYIYINDSSYEVTVSYYDHNPEDYSKAEPLYKFTLAPGEEHKDHLEGGIGWVPAPFLNRSYEGYVTISNGETTAIHYKYEEYPDMEVENNILDLESYELVNSSRDGYKRTYRYTITDDIFKPFETWTANYIYVNNTPWLITITRAYSKDGSVWKYEWVIDPNSAYTDTGSTKDGYFPSPMEIKSESPDETHFVEILCHSIPESKKTVQWYKDKESDDESLYNIHSYKMMEQTEFNATYEFTFTEEFFRNSPAPL